MSTRKHRTSPFVGLTLTLIIASFAVAGCVEDPLSPSQVTKLRILGLQPNPPEPFPGETLDLELLWTDTRPSCEDDGDCSEGQTCELGQCLRPNDDVEMVWIVSSLAAWQSSEAGFDQLFDQTGSEIPGSDGECTIPDEVRALCQLDTCISFGPLTFCCGDESLSQISITVPDDPVPGEDCDAETSIDVSPILQIQAQICIGGQIDFCDVDPLSLSFGCVGEGAETVVVSSRVQIAAEESTPNEAPTIEELTLGRLPEDDDEQPPPEPILWTEDVVQAIQGCQGNKCASRQCRETGQCQANQICDDGLCREVFSLTMGGGAQETYERSCEELASCEIDTDCAAAQVCEDGLCRRIENPVAAFYATAGAFTPGRVVLDTTGNGRPDDDRFTTRWLPPTLDPCETEDDLCSFGRCDPTLRLCTGDVSMWIVARDGRGGQTWVERTMRIVP